MAGSLGDVYELLSDFYSPPPITIEEKGQIEIYSVLSDLLELLGYDENNLFRDVSFELDENAISDLIGLNTTFPSSYRDDMYEMLTNHSYPIDVIAARSIRSTPHLAIIATSSDDSEWYARRGTTEKHFLYTYKKASDAHHMVFLSNVRIQVIGPDEQFHDYPSWSGIVTLQLLAFAIVAGGIIAGFIRTFDRWRGRPLANAAG